MRIHEALSEIQWSINTWERGFVQSMEDMTDADYAHAKKAYKDFETKDLGEYHYLHVQSDTYMIFKMY